MKKKVLIAAALISSVFSYAQEQSSEDGVVKNKKGHEILPKAGDIALGFNAIPAIDFVFNTLRYVSIMGNSAPTSVNTAGNLNSYVNASNNQIVGKYYMTDKMAIRGKIGINTISGTRTNRIQDAAAMGAAVLGSATDILAASLIQVQDEMKFSKSNVLIAGGIEFRRGYRRLQGFYGGELGVGGTSQRHSITYGNAFSDQYDVQYTTNFDNGAVSTQNPNNNRITRELSRKQNRGFIIGARGFIGIEYFVFAKISVAAEYGWGYAFTTSKNPTSEREVYQTGAAGPEVFTEEVNVDLNSNTKGFSVDNNNGTIFSVNNSVNGGNNVGGGSGSLTLLFHF
jgi:hypothetical protein